jgi:hypothetical protein
MLTAMKPVLLLILGVLILALAMSVFIDIGGIN